MLADAGRCWPMLADAGRNTACIYQLHIYNQGIAALLWCNIGLKVMTKRQKNKARVETLKCVSVFVLFIPIFAAACVIALEVGKTL